MVNVAWYGNAEVGYEAIVVDEVYDHVDGGTEVLETIRCETRAEAEATAARLKEEHSAWINWGDITPEGLRDEETEA